MPEFLSTPLPPSAYTLASLGIVGFFALRGTWRGFFKEFFSIMSLGASVILAKPFGSLFQAFLPPLEGIPFFLLDMVLLTIGGIAAYVIVRFECFLIAKLFRLYRKWEGKRNVFVRLGGALIGGLFGAALVLIIAWYILTMGVLGGSALADIVSAHREALTQSAIGSIARETSPVPEDVTKGVEILSKVTEDPAKMQRLLEAETVRNLMEEEAVLNLATDEEVRGMAEKGDIMGLMSHPAVREMMEDPGVREALQSIDVQSLMRELEKE